MWLGVVVPERYKEHQEVPCQSFQVNRAECQGLEKKCHDISKKKNGLEVVNSNFQPECVCIYIYIYGVQWSHVIRMCAVWSLGYSYTC